MRLLVDEKKQNSEGNITLTVTCSSFPFQLFKEWEQDCKARFNNCRWMKMWFDHMLARQFEALAKFLSQVNIAPDEGEEPEEEQEQKEQSSDKDETIKVIGGEING